MRRLVCGSLVALMIVLAGASEAWACPMCKMALETDDPQPRAYMLSILFMLGMIGSMFGGMAALLIWLTRLNFSDSGSSLVNLYDAKAKA